MKHKCHAFGCKSPCPPRHLMCSTCWARVSPATQAAVYATVGKRAKGVGPSWAPWWRVQAKAVYECAVSTYGDTVRFEAGYRLARDELFADYLDERVDASTHEVLKGELRAEWTAKFMAAHAPAASGVEP